MSTRGSDKISNEIMVDETSSVQDLYSDIEEKDFGKTYVAKSKLVSDAINEIGFGRYQIGLFLVTGFGWFADNAWPVATSLILPRMNEIDGVHSPTGKGPYLTLAQNLGLLAGATVWSFSSDIIGRRWAFSITFLFTGIFSTVAGASPSFASIGVFSALWSFGVGGNLPIDSAVFLEAIPGSHQWMLTLLSINWAFGQLFANFIAWGLIGNFSCEDLDNCLKKDNWGWRYFLFTLGGVTLLMFITRFLFHLFESPKFEIARGNDERAVETLHRIARINRRHTDMNINHFKAIDSSTENNDDAESIQGYKLRDRVTRKAQTLNLSHIRQCFGSRKLAMSTIILIVSWALIGLAFPLYNAFLPYYLETRGNATETLSVNDTYRNALIVALMGIPGSIIAGFLVEVRIGRKGTLFVFLIITGVVLLGSTTAKTSNQNLGWNCIFSFASNIVYGVLYAYTPEVFPTRIRGTAVGMATSANRALGVFAPIIAIYADLTTSVPIFVSGAIFIAVGFLTLLLPYEPKGKTSI